MNVMRGQSYHLTNPGISFWFYLPLPFSYDPDKKLFGVAFRGESTEKKNNSWRSTCAARTTCLHRCVDFKVCVWWPSAAEHSCCAAPRCACQHRAQLRRRRPCRRGPTASGTPHIHRSSVQDISRAPLPFPARYACRRISPPQRQGWGVQRSLIASSGCYRTESFCIIMLTSDWLQYIFLLGP